MLLPRDDRGNEQAVSAVQAVGAGIDIIYVLQKSSLLVYERGRRYEYSWFVETTHDRFARSRE